MPLDSILNYCTLPDKNSNKDVSSFQGKSQLNDDYILSFNAWTINFSSYYIINITVQLKSISY